MMASSSASSFRSPSSSSARALALGKKFGHQTQVQFFRDDGSAPASVPQFSRSARHAHTLYDSQHHRRWNGAEGDLVQEGSHDPLLAWLPNRRDCGHTSYYLAACGGRMGQYLPSSSVLAFAHSGDCDQQKPAGGLARRGQVRGKSTGGYCFRENACHRGLPQLYAHTS